MISKISVIIFILAFLLTKLSAGIEIEPSYYEVAVKEKVPQKIRYKITNQGKDNIKVKIFINDSWKKLMKGSDLVIGDSHWIKFPEKSIDLKPGQIREMDCIIDFREEGTNSSPEYLQMISFDAVSSSPVTGRISLPVYLGIEERCRLQVKCLELNYKIINNKFIQFYTILSNQGNIRLRPKLFLKVYNDEDELLESRDYFFNISLEPGKKENTLFPDIPLEILKDQKINLELEINYGKYSIEKKEVIKKHLDYLKLKM